MCHSRAPKRTKKRTNRDEQNISGEFWETPPSRIHPHLALLEENKGDLLSRAPQECEAVDLPMLEAEGPLRKGLDNAKVVSLAVL